LKAFLSLKAKVGCLIYAEPLLASDAVNSFGHFKPASPNFCHSLSHLKNDWVNHRSSRENTTAYSALYSVA